MYPVIQLSLHHKGNEDSGDRRFGGCLKLQEWGCAILNHKQDGNIRTKDSYPDGANCMRICLRSNWHR